MLGEGVALEFLPQLEALQSVRDGRNDLALLPIENRVGGEVFETLDAIYRTKDVIILDEHYLAVHHCLGSRAPDLAGVREIRSHAQAFRQCKNTLDRLLANLPIRPALVQVSSTSEAIRAAANDPTLACIGSREAHEQYGVPVLRPEFQDSKANQTRFVLMGRRHRAAATGRDRSSFLLELPHEPGTLHSLLGAFAQQKLNVLSLRSKSVPSLKDADWRYAFFVDCAGHTDDPKVNLARHAIQGLSLSFRFLGSYPNRATAEA